MSSTSSTSDEPVSRSANESKTKARQPSVAMSLAVVVLGTWIGLGVAGGVVYQLVKSGRIQLGGGSEGARSGPGRSVTLEPILANLADEGGHAFVRLGLRVDLDGAGSGDAAASGGATDGPEGEGSGPKKGAAGASTELDSSIRDAVLMVLGRQTSATLLGPDGKEHLKIELREAIEHSALRLKVKDVFLTDFIVQM